MLVRCIKTNVWNLIGCGFPVDGPVRGEICLVLGEDDECYALKGYTKAVYRKDRFVPHDGTKRGMEILRKALRPVKVDA
jgi:hypothetical protein